MFPPLLGKAEENKRKVTSPCLHDAGLDGRRQTRETLRRLIEQKVLCENHRSNFDDARRSTPPIISRMLEVSHRSSIWYKDTLDSADHNDLGTCSQNAEDDLIPSVSGVTT